MWISDFNIVKKNLHCNFEVLTLQNLPRMHPHPLHWNSLFLFYISFLFLFSFLLSMLVFLVFVFKLTFYFKFKERCPLYSWWKIISLTTPVLYMLLQCTVLVFHLECKSLALLPVRPSLLVLWMLGRLFTHFLVNLGKIWWQVWT